jgi:hypothetical protein
MTPASCYLTLGSRMHSNQEDNHVGAFWPSPLFARIQAGFWLAYILLPLFTGWLAYDWLPNESFDQHEHVSLASREHEDRNGRVTEIVTVWQNKQSGGTYSQASFADHRRSEAQRMAAIWFAYGLVGCFFYGFARVISKQMSFYEAFGKAVLVNLAIALFTWFTIAS